MKIDQRHICNLCNHQVTAQQHRFRQYSLPGVLSIGYRLMSDRHTRSITLLRMDASSKEEIIEQQVFSYLEYKMITHLLDASPDYCYFADLMAIQSGESQERCQQILDEAWENNTTNIVLKSMRSTISSLRKKLRLFGLDVHSCLGHGYVVMAVQQPAARQA